MTGARPHQLVDLGPDGIQRAGVGGRQQVEQGLVCAVVQAEQYPFRPGGQGHGAGKGFIGPQAVFTQGTEDAVAAFGQPGGTLLRGALGCDIVPHVGPGGKGQPQRARIFWASALSCCAARAARSSRVGGRLADIPQCRHQRRAEFVGQCLPALVGVEDEVFAAGVDAADGSRGQRRACIHKDALLVYEIPAGQGGAALDGQIRQGLQKAGIAALIVLKDKDLPGRVQGGVEVLQEELFGSGIGVKGQIQRGDPVALQKAPGRHAAGSFFQCKMPACACPACEQDDVAGGGGFGAQHKGAAHGPHHAVHKSILPQHRLLDLGGKAFKLPRCSGFASVVPLASRPSSSMSRSIWRLLSSAAAVASLWVLSWAFCCFNSSSSRFCCSRSAAFRSGRAALPPVLGAEAPGAALNLPPGPNTPFIRLSQSSVYAIKLPSVQCFSFSIVESGTFCKERVK